MIDRAIAIAGLAVAVIGLVFPKMFPTVRRKVGYAVLASGFGLMGVAAAIFFLPHGNVQSPPAVHQGPGSAYSYGQQGGITAGTVNIAPPRAVFTDLIGRRLLALMREKKNVTLRTVGGVADQKVGDAVQSFLEQHGFSVRRISVGMLVPPPDRPFSLSDRPSAYMVTVAPSAR